MRPPRPWPPARSAEDEAAELYAQEGVTKEMLFGLASPPEDVDEPEEPPAAAPAPRGPMSLVNMAATVLNFLRPVLPFSFGPSYSAAERAQAEEEVDRAIAGVNAELAQLDRNLAELDRSLSRPIYSTPYCSRGENYCTGAMHYTCRHCGEPDICPMTVHYTCGRAER